MILWLGFTQPQVSISLISLYKAFDLYFSHSSVVILLALVNPIIGYNISVDFLQNHKKDYKTILQNRWH